MVEGSEEFDQGTLDCACMFNRVIYVFLVNLVVSFQAISGTITIDVISWYSSSLTDSICGGISNIPVNVM